MNDAPIPSWCGDRRPRTVVLGIPGRDNVEQEWRRLRPAVADSAEIVAEDFASEFEFGGADVDLVIVLGGDGSILRAARRMGEVQRPVLGVNCGHLGFLAALSPDDFLDVWSRVCQGQFKLREHVMLTASVLRGGKVIASQTALNEAAILAGAPFAILDIDLFADGEWATRYRSDGLIIATPVGSTAYNLSAGGPIVRRHMKAVIISPLSPHTLTYRPVVDASSTVFELTVVDPERETCLVVDGNVIHCLEEGDRVRITEAAETFKMLSVPGQNDYRTLREKLGWGGSVKFRR